ncbi:MAG: hypothetical protein A2499_18935 [Stygiobacter sp. RIFOXYC12_FULL_38_8]|nr:MAG: hypothetical protein A2X62_14500 [Stygiobacter sp. GWC2_38_9]OGU84015.1 MAG: hypothetical protein A2279_11085 [Stygiobacter sp. RIFOXYA12_FULL_38_9]OGV07523.1 MAG: hypothetical protein A2299_18145 [Stygiobacter sp. RIFOXYB2_FULL_37_11]OGV11933.1 MAG: hypothetical protein A2237_08305 [Stygiobacter sp. RIFOXYA2_FULL_38_8]OGV13784.1 MAG: hypothetical protein A2440_11545 [Stygiobacter sp. RIFOXYC2_FULL_38_25]OGV23297.1 MAG: hypothetical protein A2499_18935 [Stygiobacter sp. RIFOXYC12_FULL_
MKKLLLILILFASVVFSQSEQQNIELPDFIITGRQAIDIPAAQKPKTELISILSKDFFTPQYSSEELPFLITSAPVAIYPSIKSSENYFNGNVKIMLGKETMPYGLLNLSQSFDYYLLNLKAWGTNVKDYQPFSDYNSSGIELSNDFSISTRSEFMPGAKILADAKYYRDSYYMFGSITPAQLREKNNGEARVAFSSLYSKIFNLALGLTGNLFSLNENSLKETNVLADGKINFRWNGLMFGGKAELKRQTLTNNLSGKGSYNNLNTEAYVEAALNGSLWINAGAYFNTNTSSNMFSPFVTVELLIDKGLTFGAEYKPKVDFFTMKNLLEKNPFTTLGLTDNIFTKYYNDLSATLRYEYQKVFSVALLANFAKIDNYLYYEDLLNVGKFDIQTANGVQVLKSKLNFYLQPAQFGSLFAEAIVQDVRDINDQRIPYEPVFISSFSYNYSFDSSFGFGVKYKIAMQAYADLKNTQTINNYTDLSASVWYELFGGLKLTVDFQNILNRSNFAWKQYQEKPFDYLFGFEYRW